MSNLSILEHRGQRVLTTQQLAQVYETDSNNIKNNFSNNKDRFVEGRDYFFLQSEELQEFKRVVNDIDQPFKFTSQLYLWTERGANRHCKILDTDKAWQQYDILEESYFRTKQAQLLIDYSKLSPELQMFKLILDNTAKLQLDLVEANSKATEAIERTGYIEQRLEVVKETIIQRDDNWRDSINTMVNRIAKCSADKNYQAIRSESYMLLEERAACDLNTRIRNMRQRLEDTGATKTKINSITKMDVIESDKRLKEIYTGIVKEMLIKYVA
ncbi:ORF6N domain-containing protein [Anaerospora hongkongensis]|uniref:ORF6N domain-containing protein n=1 Tax=Anaerospora hongkongensis TaxID=244830 RepID=A0A4R1QC51_9FIRM|nr:ORF6N domain-containing protein [Anaerospora hongkongensis]TCL40031.1 ORF6N domain-containing protein [Anaerospora hongkongensis]